jgi:hypothetical protein
MLDIQASSELVNIAPLLSLVDAEVV